MSYTNILSFIAVLNAYCSHKDEHYLLFGMYLQNKKKTFDVQSFRTFFPLCWNEMALKFLGDNEFMTKIFRLNKYDKIKGNS